MFFLSYSVEIILNFTQYFVGDKFATLVGAFAFDFVERSFLQDDLTFIV